MSDPTTRDRIWSAALELALEGRWSFETGDVLEAAGLDEAQRRTARRVLHVMLDEGWLQPYYSGRRIVTDWKAGDRLDLTGEARQDRDISVQVGETRETDKSVRPDDRERPEWEQELDEADERLEAARDRARDVLDEQEAAARDVDDLDLPGQGTILERRREAVQAVRDDILDRGGATKAELLEIVDAEAMGYPGGEKITARESAWRNCIQPALHDLPEVEATGSSGRWVPV